jgi:hypothetical protein
MAAGMNADPSFVINLVGKLNPAVVASVVNNNGPFVQQIMGKMDVRTTAEALNSNVPFVTALVGDLNPAVVATIVNNTASMSSQMIAYLNPAVIGVVINSSPTFLNGLVSNLEPGVIAGAINTAGGQNFLTAMLNPAIGMDPRVLAQVTNDNPNFSKALMATYNPVFPDQGGINPMIIASAINSNEPVIQGIIANLDADVINNAMDSTTLKSYLPDGSARPGGPKGMVYDLVKPVAQGGIDPAIIAKIVNSNPAFLGDLMGGMDPVATANTLGSANGRAFVNSVISGVANYSDPVTHTNLVLKNVADALCTPGAIEMSRQLMIALADSNRVNFLVGQLNLAGLNSALAMITMKTWSNNSFLSDPYMYGVFRYAAAVDAP